MEREKILIDTSVLIDHFRKQHKDKTAFYQASVNCDTVISAITEFEFSVGSTPKNHQFMEALLAQMPVFPFDLACSKIAAKVYRDLKAENSLFRSPIFLLLQLQLHIT